MKSLVAQCQIDSIQMVADLVQPLVSKQYVDVAEQTFDSR